VWLPVLSRCTPQTTVARKAPAPASARKPKASGSAKAKVSDSEESEDDVEEEAVVSFQERDECLAKPLSSAYMVPHGVQFSWHKVQDNLSVDGNAVLSAIVFKAHAGKGITALTLTRADIDRAVEEAGAALPAVDSTRLLSVSPVCRGYVHACVWCMHVFAYSFIVAAHFNQILSTEPARILAPLLSGQLFKEYSAKKRLREVPGFRIHYKGRCSSPSGCDTAQSAQWYLGMLGRTRVSFCSKKCSGHKGVTDVDLCTHKERRHMIVPV
jgi:hypothetical protein